MSFVMLNERSVWKKGSNPTALEEKDKAIRSKGGKREERRNELTAASLRTSPSDPRLWTGPRVEEPDSKRRVSSTSLVPVRLSNYRAVLVHEDLSRSKIERSQVASQNRLRSATRNERRAHVDPSSRSDTVSAGLVRRIAEFDSPVDGDLKEKRGKDDAKVMSSQTKGTSKKRNELALDSD